MKGQNPMLDELKLAVWAVVEWLMVLMPWDALKLHALYWDVTRWDWSPLDYRHTMTAHATARLFGLFPPNEKV